MNTISKKLRLFSVIIVLVLVFYVLPVSPVAATSTSISLDEFASALKNTDSAKLVGLYVENIIAVRVVQQSSPSYVSSIKGTVTQFGLAADYGSIGLLAHNYLSGSNFPKLQSGMEIVLIYGDGSIKRFQVSSTKKYQALNPTDPYSKFVNMENPEITLTSTEVFKETYGIDGNLVLQTCITKNGNSSWGRLFIIASPIE